MPLRRSALKKFSRVDVFAAGFAFCFAMSFAHAQFATGAFFKRRAPILVFTSAVQSPYVNNCSLPVTIQNRNAAGASANVSPALTIALSSSSVSTTFYLDTSCNVPITTATIGNNQNSTTFYFRNTSLETVTLTATATGRVPSNQDAIIGANPFIWTGGGADANWNTALNWSGGSPATGAAHIAVFDGTCVSNCSPNIAASISIRGLRIDAGYAGTITQGAGAVVTLGAYGYSQDGGTFVGGSSDIVISQGPFYIRGGTFTSTTADLKLVDAKGGYDNHDKFVVTTANSFVHNGGRLWLDLRSNNYAVYLVKVAANNNFNNVLLRVTAGVDDAVITSEFSPTRPVIDGDLALEHSAWEGPWELKGDLSFGASFGSYIGPEDATLFFTGAGEQTIDNTVGVAMPNGLVTVDKPAASKLTLLSNYTRAAGQSVTVLGGRINLSTFNMAIPGTLSLATGTEVYLNGQTLTVGGGSIPAGSYSSGTVFAGAAP